MAVAERSRNYIGGEWVDGSGGETFVSLVPATGETIGEFPRSTAADVERAVAAAKEAWEDWRLVPAPKRAEVLYRFAGLITEHTPGTVERLDAALRRSRAPFCGLIF